MVSKGYRIKLTQKAAEDLDEIYGYISAKLLAADAADNLMDKIERNIMRLADFPFSCGHALDETLKDRGYRRLIIDNYIAFYLVDDMEKQVVIMRILYGASNYGELL